MSRLLFSLMLFLALMGSGCASLLPSSRATVKSPWATFDEAKETFDKIIKHETTTKELHSLGYDPYATPNIRILTYLDIMNIFMPNPSIKKEDLNEGVKLCIEAQGGCKAYRFEPQVLKSKRYGNFFLDVFNFKRKTQETGWRFTALVILVNDTVVYKLWSGNPAIDEVRETTNPLGPLQRADEILFRGVMSAF